MMKFGLLLNHKYLPGDDIVRRIDELVRTTELARDLGFDLLMTHHHFIAKWPTPQPAPLLAHLAASSGRMRLGIGVYIASLEHPVALAETFATIDQISGGRLVLGVGSGYRQEEFDVFGVPIEARWSRLYETLVVIERLWTGEPVTHRGQHFTIEGQTVGMTPKQRPRPPIWIGAGGPRTIKEAAQYGDTWLCSPGHLLPRANELLRGFRHEQQRLGKDVSRCEYPLLRELFLADDDATARSSVEGYLRSEYQPTRAEAFEDLWRDAFLVGSPASVMEKIAACEAGGWTTLVVRASWPGASAELTHQTLTRFAEEVMPAFCSSAPGQRGT
jgi:alkanesulfonate monooxygenase SsuD/methylene tetrahydromethanopterin reductase-like flavin-dependent oxidoreductase (luciferase family)